MPRQYDVEFGLGKHGCRNNRDRTGYRGMPSASAKAVSFSRIEPAPFLRAIRPFTKACALPASSSIAIALTGPTAEGTSDSLRKPSAMRASALKVFDAI